MKWSFFEQIHIKDELQAIESAEAAVDSLQDSCFNLEERIEELNETKQNIQDSQKQGNNLLTSLTSGSTFYCFPQGKAVSKSPLHCSFCSLLLQTLKSRAKQ